MLSFLLATHPAISTIGERRKFYNKSIQPHSQHAQRCSCGELFRECPFWNEIKVRVLNEVTHEVNGLNPTEFQLHNNKYLNKVGQKILEAGILHQLPMLERLYRRQMDYHARFNTQLVRSVLELENNEVFLDSSKSIAHALFLSRIPQFDLHIIWLSRDPRAQVSSALKYNDWDVAEATQRWKREMLANEQALKKMNVPYLSLTYEALCREPEQEMARLLRFAGLDPAQFSLDFRSRTQHIMGNYAMRLGQDKRIEERKDWLERLSPEQIQLIEQMTTDFRQYYTPNA